MAQRAHIALQERRSRLQKRLSALGQEHVFRWWPELSETQRAGLLAQLEQTDFDLLARLVGLVGAGPSPIAALRHWVPPPYVPLPRSGGELARERSARAVGEAALREGKVGVVAVAGGQGTRLQFGQPKGFFPIGPVTGKSLFRMHAEQVLALRGRYGAALPWLIMVSDATQEPTEIYFRENSFFGLPRHDVIFFRQGMLPAIDQERRLLLAEKDSLFLSPNGHGGTIRALADEGALGELEKRGVRHLFYFQVDNPAVNVADAVFLGHHLLAGSEMSLKVMRRRDAEERVGVMVMSADEPPEHGSKLPPGKAAPGRPRVIEYSDLTRELKYAGEATGELMFPMGSPAIHILELGFVRRLAQETDALPYHVAHKPIPYLDERGQRVCPKEPNGFKFETFIFDALPLAANPVLVEMDRAEEFAPLKNAEGEDSPATCRRGLCGKYARWLERAGVPVPRDERGLPRSAIEISPLYALGPEELSRKLPRGFRVEGEKVYLGP